MDSRSAAADPFRARGARRSCAQAPKHLHHLRHRPRRRDRFSGDGARRGRVARSAPLERAAAVDEAVGRAIEIANALDEAHRQGIIHRDLKPGNVMLRPAPARRAAHAKLLDFGLARIVSLDMTAQLSSGSDASMTEGGGLFGTVEYGPRADQGSPTDARTDVFAFGALLYEMLTGRMAFGRATKPDGLAAVLRDHPDQTVLERSGAASSVIRIVGRCLEKESGDRFQTARDLAFALGNAASTQEPETRRSRVGSITGPPDPAAPRDLRALSDDCVGGHGRVDGRGPCRGAADPEHHSVHLVASHKE